MLAITACTGAAHGAVPPGPYPQKSIRIIVPFAPQGPNDILARLVGQKLNETWGQQVIVDNRPGGGTVIGTELAARAPADGYTLLMVSTSTAVNPTLKRTLPYDTVRDFAPVIRLAETPNVLASHPSLPATNVAGLVKLAKAKPGEITYASGGVGTSTHLGGEMLAMMGGVKMTHVAYKGAAPGVPTIGETLPGFGANSWFGIFAPANTPREIVTRLNTEIARVLATPAVREQLALDGAEVIANTPEQFAEHFRSEIAKWGKVVELAGVRER